MQFTTNMAGTPTSPATSTAACVTMRLLRLSSTTSSHTPVTWGFRQSLECRREVQRIQMNWPTCSLMEILKEKKELCRGASSNYGRTLWNICKCVFVYTSFCVSEMISMSPVDYNTKHYIPHCTSCVIWMQFTFHYECMVALQYYLYSNVISRNPSAQSDVKWEPTQPDTYRLLDIGTELSMIDYPHSKTSYLWDEIYEKYYYTRNRISN